MSDLAARLAELEEMVREAKSMPLSSSALLNRDELIEMLQKMQEELPEEIKQARWVVKDREELLAKARAESERIVEQAHEDQLRMARREEVVERARLEAERVLEEAEAASRTIRKEAEDYVDGKLAQFEIALRKVLEDSQLATKGLARTLDTVEVGRDRLRNPATTAEQEFGSTDDPDPRPAEPAAATELFDLEGKG
jgi:cell division septum initiation protein DivIVA